MKDVIFIVIANGDVRDAIKCDGGFIRGFSINGRLMSATCLLVARARPLASVPESPLIKETRTNERAGPTIVHDSVRTSTSEWREPISEWREPISEWREPIKSLLNGAGWFPGSKSSQPAGAEFQGCLRSCDEKV